MVVSVVLLTSGGCRLCVNLHSETLLPEATEEIPRTGY